ncbi:biotin transporter BioY [Lachnospiraceae bacterium 42-17]|nr:biotin transporter BioY [Dorea sp.]
MTKSKLSVQEVCLVALCTAVMVIMAQISIPMPMGVPMTMQTFAVTLAAVVLGAKKGALSAFVYILLGAVGLPVLAGFTGGIQYFAGPTGGFLISFPLMAFVIGLGVDRFREVKGGFILCLIGGTIVNYVIGVLMFCLLMDSSVMTAVSACVLPFVPTAVIKAVLASVIGLKIRGRLGVILCA